jgi:hypothetical protein
MSNTQAKKVSLALQRIANEVNASLRGAAGEECAFMLIMQTPGDGIVQYVSNAARADAALLMVTQLQHWDAGRADIPAHYNPNLKQEGGKL